RSCSSTAGVCFFQAEDGIRDFHVTGVQTCALPIYLLELLHEVVLRVQAPSRVDDEQVLAVGLAPLRAVEGHGSGVAAVGAGDGQIGRASCRARVGIAVGTVARTVYRAAQRAGGASR